MQKMAGHGFFRGWNPLLRRLFLFASLTLGKAGTIPCGVFPAPFSVLRGASGASPGRPPARVSPRKNCQPDSFFSPSCASLRITRSAPVRLAPGRFRALRSATRGTAPRPRGLLKKAGENFYHLAQKTPPHFRRRRLKYLFSR